MLKRLLACICLALLITGVTFAERLGSMKIQGRDCQYDTLIHRHIGPGVTYTQFQFNDIYLGGAFSYKMRTHLITIDMTNPYNTFTPCIVDDEYYEYNTQEYEVNRQKNLGLKPIASVNGGTFEQSKTNGDPFERFEIPDVLVGKSVIKYEDDSPIQKYYTDSDKVPHMGTLTMKATVTAASGKTAVIGQINHYRDRVRNSAKLALFCNGMNRAKDNNTTDGVEVFLKGDDIKVGKNQLTVVKTNKGCGSPIGSGMCVLTGVGASEEFLNQLAAGDQVTIDIDYTDAQNATVSPVDIFEVFIRNCVTNGVAYGDPRINLAYPATGISKDGKTVYWADLEISTYSDAPLRCLEDFLINVGAWNAFYHDGGPSAEMTVDGKYVTNNSIGYGFNGRYISGMVVLYSTAPNDNIIATVECEDNSPQKMIIGDQLKLKVFGYNQFGEMIDDNAAVNSAVEISVSGGIGTVSGGVFTPSAAGEGVISIGVKGAGTMVKIPVSVANDGRLEVSPKNVFTGEDRPVQLSVQYVTSLRTVNVDPADVYWSIDNPYVIASCDDGLVVPQLDGYSCITATYGGASTEVNVTVENLESASTVFLDLTDNWKAAGEDLHIPSVPRSMILETQSFGNDRISVMFAQGESQNTSLLSTKGDGAVYSDTITFDYDAPDTYPITLNKLSPENAASITGLRAYYKDIPTAIRQLTTADFSGFEVLYSNGTVKLLNRSSATKVHVSVYTLNGAMIAEESEMLNGGDSVTFDVKTNDPLLVRVQTDYGTQVYKVASAK